MSWISGVVDFAGDPAVPDPVLDMVPDCLPPGSVVERSAPGIRWICADGIVGDPSRGVLSNRAGLGLVVADLRLDGVTETDWGEWLLTAYERWRFDLPEHLAGAFAFALWDPSRRSLLLARDAVGERALYFRSTGRRLAFASEPAALSRLGGRAARPHSPRLLSHLVGAAPDPVWSFFEDVSRLPEGHRLVATERGQALEPWTRGRSPVRLPRARVVEELPRALARAVGRRLGLAGEQAVLLSGGLDSVTVATEAARLLADRRQLLHAFTWSSATGDAIDERASSGLLVSHQTNIREHPVEADGLWPLSRFPEAYEDPNDPVISAYPDLLLATLERARAAQVSVLLNGVGGDPTFGWSVPELALLMGWRLWPLYRRGRASGVLELARRLLRPLRRLWLPDWLTEGARREIRHAGLDRPPLPAAALRSARQFRRHLLESSAQAIHLERFDRLSRRHRIRIACPWHDRELAQLALRSPDSGLAASPPLKQLVRAAFVGRIPEKLLAAPTDKRSASRLRARGLLDLGRATVEGLLEGSRLAEFDLLDSTRILRTYRNDISRRVMIPRLLEVLSAEIWLRKLTL